MKFVPFDFVAYVYESFFVVFAYTSLRTEPSAGGGHPGITDLINYYNRVLFDDPFYFDTDNGQLICRCLFGCRSGTPTEGMMAKMLDMPDERIRKSGLADALFAQTSSEPVSGSIPFCSGNGLRSVLSPDSPADL